MQTLKKMPQVATALCIFGDNSFSKFKETSKNSQKHTNQSGFKMSVFVWVLEESQNKYPKASAKT